MGFVNGRTGIGQIRYRAGSVISSILGTRSACSNTVTVGFTVSPFVAKSAAEITRYFSVRSSLVEGVIVTER